MLSDAEITLEQEKHEIITPFVPKLVREVGGQKVVSYGLTSAGYDLRLSGNGCFKLKSDLIDVKSGNDYEIVDSESDKSGTYYTIEPWGSVLCVSVEKLNMPAHLKATCIGKSTYARAGLICNTTPIEPGWCGYVTLELANTHPSHLKVYINEGIAQLEFHRITPSDNPYGNRKYQNQPHIPVLPRV